MLTHANYYTRENKYLTNSKISCFLYDKPTFKKRYIDYSEPQEETKSLLIGKAVDEYIVNGANKFKAKYDVKVLKKDFPVKFEAQKDTKKTLLTQTDYDKVVKMCGNLIGTTIAKELRSTSFKKNKIFKVDTPLGIWKGLAGIPDFYQVNADEAVIVDLKTTNTIGEKFVYHAFDYGYFRQMAVYSYLIGMNIKKVNSFKYYILAVENTEPHRVQLYRFDPCIIDQTREYLFKEIIPSIVNEKTFSHPDVNWNNYIDLII